MKKKITKILTFSVALFILIVFFAGLNKDPRYKTKNLTGNTIKNFELSSFNSNEIINQEILKKSKYTLINFWASWCSPCRKEHPFLLQLNKLENLKIIGINFKDKKNHASDFLSELGNPYHVLAKDDKGKHSILFGVYGIPESILINDNLTIEKKFVGPITENDFIEIKNHLKK